MSPLMRARLQRFTHNRLGMGCLIIFILIFICSLAAEFIANDKPLLVKYENSYYVGISGNSFWRSL